MFLLPPDEPDRDQLVTIAQQEHIVVAGADERQIRRALNSLLRHTNKRAVARCSGRRPYLQCRGRYKLLEFGAKALPYLLEHVARHLEANAYLGAARIDDPKVRTVEEVYDYNHDPSNETMTKWNTLSPWLLTILMEELVPVDKTPRRDRGNGIAPTDCFVWLGWWQENRPRFAFETDPPPTIPAPVATSPGGPTSTRVQDGLLDIRAYHATQRHIIERAAAELGVDVFIGAHRGLDMITGCHMRSVTFEEFLHFLGHARITYRKEGARYLIGGREPARPRLYIHDWGIMMWRTVFYPGDGIYASVLLRQDVIPTQGSILDEGRFVIENPKYLGRSRQCRVLPAGPEGAGQAGSVCDPSGDGLGCNLMVDPRCGITPGEYTMHFAWGGEHTPKISIELYQEVAHLTSERDLPVATLTIPRRNLDNSALKP